MNSRLLPVFMDAALALVAACAGDPPPPPSANAVASFAPDSTVVRVVGTGAMTPLAMRLAAAWTEHLRGEPVVVEASVGSGGGIRAAVEGAADLGMISRGLTDNEMHLQLLVVPIARDAVVLATHPGVGAKNLTSAQIMDFYSGSVTMFPDGTPVTVLLRDRQESANGVLDRMVPGLAAIREEARRTHRFQVLYHDDAMGVTLATLPGALGVFSLGVAVTGKVPLNIPAIDGVVPSLTTMADGSWIATRELAFVLRPDRLERVRPFLKFVGSSDGRQLIEASGYLPLPFSGVP